jgi:predicted 2-oxoglutarate/Fe(II)-dependent dioxygenase YbiX
MPRITIPRASGVMFDSFDPALAGVARVYLVGPPSFDLSSLNQLERWESVLHLVLEEEGSQGGHDAILDRAGEVAQAFATTPPFAIVVDAGGRISAVLPSPGVESILREVSRLYRSSNPLVVHAQAPVLLLERVLDHDHCRRLIECWQTGKKRNDEVGSAAGNIVNADVKRRQDVEITDRELFNDTRDCLVRRIAPAIHQAFHAETSVMEAPRIGCYEAASGGWFRRHRDNTSRATAHRQFAISINLNEYDDYDGGEVRFPEFGRELYRPHQGAALVFSTSLLHEVLAVTRGRRIGLFTFLSASAPHVHRRF